MRSLLMSGARALFIALVTLAATACQSLLQEVPRTPVIVKFRESPFVKRSYAKVIAGGVGTRQLLAGMVAACARAIQSAFNAPFRLAGWSPAMYASGHIIAPGSQDANLGHIRRMKADHAALIKELELGQAEMRAGEIPHARGVELEGKAKEAEEIQKKIDQYNKVAGITAAARELDSRTMPASKSAANKIVTTPGHLFVLSDAFRQYGAQSKQGWSAKVDIKSIRGGKVQLHGEEADAYQVKAEQLPSIGADSIVPIQMDNEIVRFEEPEILSIRDLMTVLPTTADTIRFVKHVATGRAAKGVEKGTDKPWLDVDITASNVSVETIAVLSKVTEQDIDDAPRLIGMINGEMRLDVKVEEERQLLHGAGSGGEITGLYGQGVEAQEFDRAQVGDSLIDIIRRMRTDLRKRRVTPNGVAIDPVDWEEIELQKGSTNDHYIWGLVSDLRGPRIWSLRVVESDAMTNPDTGERRVLMGDFIRGATLYDRHDVRLAVGFVDDDFAKNLRTLRAEERIALAVKRAFAFLWTQTSTGS